MNSIKRLRMLAISATTLTMLVFSVPIFASEDMQISEKMADSRYEFRSQVKQAYNLMNFQCKEIVLPEDRADFDAQITRYNTLANKIKSSELAYDFEVAIEDEKLHIAEENQSQERKCGARESDLEHWSKDWIADHRSAIDKIERRMNGLAGYVSPDINPKIEMFGAERAALRNKIKTYQLRDSESCIFEVTPSLKAANIARLAAYAKFATTMQRSSMRLDFEAVATELASEQKLLWGTGSCLELDPPTTTEEKKRHGDEIAELQKLITEVDGEARALMANYRTEQITKAAQ